MEVDNPHAIVPGVQFEFPTQSLSTDGKMKDREKTVPTENSGSEHVMDQKSDNSDIEYRNRLCTPSDVCVAGTCTEDRDDPMELNSDSRTAFSTGAENKDVVSSDFGGTPLQVESNSEAFQINHMLTDLAQTDAHFKSQQRGEPDLTTNQKYQIAYTIFANSPSSFLSRFADFLKQEDLLCFAKYRGDYEVDFHLKRIEERLNDRTCVKVVKNRRFSAMQKLLDEGEYFSEEEMKYRDPLLYEEMVGKHLTDDEIQSRVDKTDLKFSSILLKHIDQLQENKLYYEQKETLECQEEEEGEEDEDNEDEESELESDSEEKPQISDHEKESLRSEFLEIMKEKFLSGADKQFFDYSKVDTNTDYDSLEIIEQDEQDRYFDED